MNAIAPQAVRRYDDEPRAGIDRALALAVVLALALVVTALVASVGGAVRQARDDVATFAAFSVSAKAEALARAIAEPGARRSALDARQGDALVAMLDDPALRLAQPTTLAVARVRASDLASSAREHADATSEATVARALAAFEGALENVRAEITDVSTERARLRPRVALAWAVAIVLAFVIVVGGASLRLRWARTAADRFSGMLERMIADLARGAVDAQEAKRTMAIEAKARGRFVMTVDFRYVVTKPYSEELGEIFDIGDLDGYPFGALLRRIAPHHDRAALAQLAERLFDPTFSDASLAKHPLQALRCGTQTLAFDFERIWDREDIESVVVAVSDITQAEALAPEPSGGDLGETRKAAYEAFVAATSRPLADALVTDIAAYTIVLGRTLRSNDMPRQLGKLHEATTGLLDRLVALDFTCLASRVARFDALTVHLLGRPNGAGADDLSYAIAIAELTAELEALRAVVPRTPGVRSAAVFDRGDRARSL